jgi:hypothetical protein
LVLNESEFYSHQHFFCKDSTGYADMAYRLTNRLVKYTKKEVDENEDGRYAQFNIQLSSARVKVEHAFGNMKNRFPLLSGLSTMLGSKEGNKRGVDFIFVVLTLCLAQFSVVDG